MGMTDGKHVDMDGPETFENVFRPDLKPKKQKFEDAKCVHKLNMKGHGDPWCVLFHKTANCDNCHGVSDTNNYHIGGTVDVEKLSAMSKRERLFAIYGGSPERMKQLDHIKSLLGNLQVEAHISIIKTLGAKLLGRPGVSVLLDEFLIDEQEWVSPFTEGELVTYNDQLARVIKIVGPVVKIRLQRRDYPKHLDVMDWDLEKRSISRWVKKLLRRLWQKIDTK